MVYTGRNAFYCNVSTCCVQKTTNKDRVRGRMGLVPKVWWCKLQLNRGEREGVESKAADNEKNERRTYDEKYFGSPWFIKMGDSFAVSVAEQ